MNDQLLQRVKSCPSLPSLPAIAVEVLELTRDADVDIGAIAKLISRDPAMSGKILKTVNSSFYGRSQHVSTISHALVILGLQTVKTLVLGFSLVNNLAGRKAKGFDHLTYWKRSIYAATAARTCAAKAGVAEQEEAFLAALLADIGMLVLDVAVGEAYGPVHAAASSHNDLIDVEREVLGGTHAEVGGILAGQWKLPPMLSMPIAHHHRPSGATDPAARRLAELVGLAGRVADVFVDADPAPALTDVRRLLAELCGVTDVAEADALLADIGNRTKEAAGLFEINIGSAADFESIRERANEALVELSLRSQVQVTQLAERNEVLQRAATTDGLTGLHNRAGFDAFLAEQFAAARAAGQCLSLLLMDVDKFKSVNDTHGHPAGDAVLRAIAGLVARVARSQDMAARFGGEEICLVLPGTTRATAAAVAETIRYAISCKAIPIGATAAAPPAGGDVKGSSAEAIVALAVTASFGVAVYEPGCPLREASHLLKAADLAVYAAKKAGRNCVRVFTLPPLAARPAA